MPVLKNPRHERFVQYLAGGKTATEAYALAGYKPSRANASHLLDNPDVSERLRQITTKRAVAAAVTAESLIEQNQKVFDAACDAKQFSATVGANKEISILAGIRIERSEIGSPGEFEAMSDAELLTALQERFAKLMAELRLPITNGSIALNGNGTDTDIEGS
jgi:phage terminase small subunit